MYAYMSWNVIVTCLGNGDPAVVHKAPRAPGTAPRPPAKASGLAAPTGRRAGPLRAHPDRTGGARPAVTGLPPISDTWSRVEQPPYAGQQPNVPVWRDHQVSRRTQPPVGGGGRGKPEDGPNDACPGKQRSVDQGLSVKC